MSETLLAASGLSATNDVTPPVIVARNLVQSLDASGNALVNPADADSASFDTESGIAGYALSQIAFDCSNIGVNNVWFYVSDAVGNTDSVQIQVSIVDDLPPTIVLNSITVYLDASGSVALNQADLDAGTTDNCGPLSWSFSPATFTCADLGIANVTASVTDPSGNLSQQLFQVIVSDTIGPNIGSDTVKIAIDASGTATLDAAALPAGFNDNCSATSWSFSQSSFFCSDVGVHIVSATGSDADGNMASGNIIVLVEDLTPPNVVANNLNIPLDAAGTATITTAMADAGTSDNCGIQSLTLSKTTFDCSTTGVNNVNLIATDVNGNTSLVTFTVTVTENTPPSFTPRSDTITLDFTNQVNLTLAMVASNVTDNCAVVSQAINPSTLSNANLGMNAISVTVFDASGNSVTNTSFIWILDRDTDGDGIPDSREGDGDPDGDGIPNYLDLDSDGDLIPDQTETDIDSDGDGIPNFLDLDSDNDGIADRTETAADADGDGIPNYLDLDSDGDGISDEVEGASDADGDGIPNFLDLDSDGDNIPDQTEGNIDSDGDGIPNFLDTDSDGDTILDIVETDSDEDSDGIPNYLDLDSDGDGIDDQIETDDDFDSDGIPNFLDLDSDGDGISDAVETADDADGDGRPNFLDLDSDGDGILDIIETAADADSDGIPNFLDLDSDGDGIDDSIETDDDADGDGTPNFLDLDSDGDKILDEIETAADADGDGTPNFLDLDSDGDTIPDSVETARDTDGDGIPDFLDLDSDNDGLSDQDEYLKDCNNDGISDHLQVLACSFLFPQGISPNGDNLNDFFVIKGMGDLLRASIVIFDEFGNIIYQNPDYQNEWEGQTSNPKIKTNSLNKVPLGTYFYTFKFTAPFEDTIKGFIYVTY